MTTVENRQNVSMNNVNDNKVYISVMGALIVVICFFLPWIEIDCMGKKTMSGADIGGVLWIIPIGAAVFIFAFFTFYKKNEIYKIIVVALINFFVSASVLGYRYLSFTENLKKELGSTPESLGMTTKYGAILTIIGELIILAGCVFIWTRKETVTASVQDTGEVISQIEKLGALREKNLITEEEFQSQKAVILSSGKTSKPVNLSQGAYPAFFENAGKWLKKNKKIVLSAAGGIVLLLLVYVIFVNHYPGRDGKSAASNYCDCTEQYNKDIKKVKEEFLKSFNTYNFQNRGEARNKLRDITDPIDRALVECNEKASTKYDEYRTRYSNDKEAIKKFDDSYSERSNNCSSSEEEGVFALNSQINQKIYTLTETEPDQEKIKNDLLGNKVPGWNFDYLSEFKKFEILNLTKNSNRLEYLIKTEVYGESSQSLHELELMVVYIISDEGWLFNSVTENYITYDNVLPDDSWKSITPLKNCKLTFDINKKFTMKTNEYSEEYIFGPDSDTKVIPYSSIYLAKSREGKPITVRFKYTAIK